MFVCVFLAQYFGKTVGLENVLFTFTFLGPDRENFGEGPLFESLLSGSFCPTPWKWAGRLRGWHQSVQETVHITEAQKQRRRPEAGGGQTIQRPALNLLPPSVPPGLPSHQEKSSQNSSLQGILDSHQSAISRSLGHNTMNSIVWQLWSNEHVFTIPNIQC